MAGTKIFKSDCYLDILTSSPSLTNLTVGQSIFKLTWDFFKQLEVAGYTTEIARNNGNSATFSPKSLGTDFHDGTSPFGENAWAVFRFNTHAGRTFPYYVFFQWNAGSDFGSAPGSPALIQNSAGLATSSNLGFQVATAIDSLGAFESPWPVAATGSMGSDTKQNPVWNIPSGGLGYFFPRSNNTGYSHATSKQNTVGIRIGTIPSINLRLDFVADKDNFAIVYNDNTTFSENTLIGVGVYTPDPTISPAEIPLFMVQTSVTGGFVTRGNTWGTTTGDTTREGGISLNKIGPTTVLNLNFGWESSPDRSYFNNLDVSSLPYEGLYPISLLYNGYFVGYADTTFWRMCFGSYSRDTTYDKDWIVVDSDSVTSTPNNSKLLIPWDGVSSKGNNFTRTGVILP